MKSDSFKYQPLKAPIDPIKKWINDNLKPQIELTDELLDAIAKRIQVKITEQDIYGQTHTK